MIYITKGDTIIFSFDFNENLDINLISGYARLIFSDYELNDTLFKAQENNDICDLNCKYSKFNKKVNNLPQNITHLTFGYWFNQEVNALPQGLTHLTFGLSRK